jgi:AAA+ ATPase superfamily predicted ATPase
MPTVTNPFVYGGIVTGDAFCDREKELEELLEDIQAGQNVIIYSQRRFGKTSLMRKLLDEAHKKDIVTVYVDLYPISTLGELIEDYARAIAQSLSAYEKAKRLMQSLFSRLHLTMGLDASGDPKWSVGFDRNQEMFFPAWILI